MSEENEKSYIDALFKLSTKTEPEEKILITIDEEDAACIDLLMGLMNWDLQEAINSALSYYFNSKNMNVAQPLEADEIKQPIEINIQYKLKIEKLMRKSRTEFSHLQNVDSLIASRALQLLRSILIAEEK